MLGSTHGRFGEFANLLALCAGGRVRPVIDSRHALDGLHAALDRLAAGRQFGKISVEI